MKSLSENRHSGRPGLDRREAPDRAIPGPRKDSSPGHPIRESCFRKGSKLLRSVPFIAFLLLAPFAAAAESAETSKRPAPLQRPNLIAIVTDDQAQWGMGLYGNREIHTPQMDRIGREGALFLNAFVATPVCSPSRATYLTGRYPSEVGITDWISPAEANAGLGLEGATWPQVLSANGYRTAIIGKWHLGTKPQFHPTRLGFGHFMGFLAGGNRPMDPLLEVNRQNKRLKGPLPDLLTDEAIRFVRANRAGPFALCLHYRAPHTPYGPVPEIDSAPYADLETKTPVPRGADAARFRRWHREYYASIASVDRNIGRLLTELDELMLANNTLLFFTSDHGYNLGRHNVSTKGNGHWIAGGVNGPKRPNMWDTSIRVPLAVRWPAVIEPGSKHEAMVSNLDMFRTVLGALGVPPPADAPARGIDYSPLFRGESIEERKILFGQYDLHNYGLAYMRMVRTKNYKYVRHFKANGMDELYDLEADPGETRNLASRRSRGESAAVIQRLGEALQQWQESIDDPLLKSSY